MARSKYPGFMFYPGDWLRDSGVNSLTREERDIWHDLLCVMHDCEPRGTLSLNGEPMSLERIARACRNESIKKIEKTLKILENLGIISLEKSLGIYFCRRMVRDTEVLEKNRANGRRGGNPAFLAVSNAAKILSQKTAKDEIEKSANPKNNPIVEQKNNPTVNPKNNPTVERNGGFGLTQPVNRMCANANASASSTEALSLSLLESSNNEPPLETCTTPIISLPNSCPEKVEKISKKRIGTWIQSTYRPTADEWGRLLQFAGDECFPDHSEAELNAKLESILREFIEYWIDMRELDKRFGKQRGRKQNWYMALRMRVKTIAYQERRKQTANVLHRLSQQQPNGNGSYQNERDRRAAADVKFLREFNQSRANQDSLALELTDHEE